MSTDDINTQTGTAGGSAGGATTNLTLDASLFANVAVPVPIGPRSFNDPEVGFGLKTTHEDCAIIMAERRDTTPDETTGDETTDDETTDAGTVLCDNDDPDFFYDYLSTLTYDELVDKIDCFLMESDQHCGYIQCYTRVYLTFEYVYDEEGREAQNLHGVTDNELRRIVAAGSGHVYVEWYPC